MHIETHINKYNEVLKIFYDNENNKIITYTMYNVIVKNLETTWNKKLNFKIINEKMWAHFMLKIIVKSCLNKTENSLKDLNDVAVETSALENSKYFIENYKYSSNLVEDISNNIEKLLLIDSIICGNIKILTKNKIKKYVFNLVEELTEAKVLDEKIIKQKVKTIKLKKINYININKNKYFELEYYEQPFNIIFINNSLFLINSYIFSLKFAIKNNKFNSENIKIKNFTFLQNVLSIPYFVENELTIKVKDEIIKTTEFISWEKILSGDELEKLKNTSDEDLKLKLKEAKEKYENIKNIYSDKYKHIYVAYKQADKNRKNLQKIYNKKYSILITLNIFYKFFEELKERTKPFYLASYVDFRGRIYLDSKISPTSSRIYRHLYHYGYYSEEELQLNNIKLNESKAFNIIKNKFYIIKDLENESFKLFNLTKKNILLWLILELGKINKKNIMKNGEIKLEDFIKNGYEIFLRKEIPNDFEEKIIYLKITDALDSLLKNKKIKKTIIYKDSTASVLQHLTKLLGFKSEKILEIMNINAAETWSDPYTYIINLYKIRYPIKDERIIKIFNRKNLKKLIMTINYSLTYKSAIEYFFQEANDDIKKLIAEDNSFTYKLISEVKKFYNYLKNDVEKEELFEKSSNELIKLWFKGREITTKDGAIIDLNYKKIIKKSIETTILGKRKSMINYTISEEYDKRKTNIALRANLIHSMDSIFARDILSIEKIISIHDSFGISIAEVSFLIDLANTVFIEDSFKEKIIIHNKDIKKTFSIFLLL